MKLRTSLSGFRATFLAGLGLVPITACGGATIDGSQGNPSPTGGAGGSGGSYQTGGRDFGGMPVGGYPQAGGSGGVVVTGGAPGYRVCSTLTPILGPSGEPTGYSTCNGTGTVRTSAANCPSSIPRSGTIVLTYDAGIVPECTQDSDCTAKPHGYCTQVLGGMPGGTCIYGCVADSECSAGTICSCGDPVGQCVVSECGSDGSCVAPSLCASYTPAPGCPGIAFGCTSQWSSCLTDLDCPDGSLCTLDGDILKGRNRMCQAATCVVGRPFLVQGEARLADCDRRRDWTSSLAPDVEGLPASTRFTAAARWTEIGLMEHASIAAFARFALELLSLGAPPSLVAETQDAMRDETLHARDAFALAGGYAGAPVGPGKLSLDGSLTDRTPLEILSTTILEGCIGETVAAVEAREALQYATDPAVRQALERVALDEQRHAELAWRFVRWMLSEGPVDVRTVALGVFNCCIEEASRSTLMQPGPDRDDSQVLRAHGVLPVSLRNEIRAQVLADVVVPCAKALFAASGHSEERLSVS